MRTIPRQKTAFTDDNLLSIDDRIAKAQRAPILTRDLGGNPLFGTLDNVERPSTTKLIENEAEILSLLMKASGQSQHVAPSFYEGGDDVYIQNKENVDVTVTDADRRAIHTISNYYNTLGIYRDDFDKTTNDKLARNAYYALCEKAMMDYMRSVQWKVKDSRNGDIIESATEFFDAPNPQDTFGDQLAMLIRDITRYDAGVIVKSFNKGGYMTEIKPYLATEFWREQDRVPFIVNVPIMNTVDLTGGAYASHQQPTYQGWWSHGYTERFWQRSRTGVYIPFQPEEVCYCMMYPRTDGIYGTDFIKFLKYQIQYLIDSTKAAGKTFENGVVPSVVWEHPGVHSIAQLKQRIAELKYNNQGWQRFGSVIHTVEGEKVNSFAHTLVDMQWLEGQKFVAQLVWATWGFSPEEFMGGGESRASSYVKRNITKSRLLYPLMTFIEQRINREILPYMKGYRKFWKFSFVRDIDLDDEQKVATTNSIKASTFLQYYSAGFPIEASMELSGLDKSQYKFDIDHLEAEIMQNQLMMSGQQPGELTAGGLEDQEMGRYGPGSESYSDYQIESGQGTSQPERTSQDPEYEEQPYRKAAVPMRLPRANPDQPTRTLDKPKLPRVKCDKRLGSCDVGSLGVLAEKAKDPTEPARSNAEVEDSEKDKGGGAGAGIEQAVQVGLMLAKSQNINLAHIAGAVGVGYAGAKLKQRLSRKKEEGPTESKPATQSVRGEASERWTPTSHVNKRIVLPDKPGGRATVEQVPPKYTAPTTASEPRGRSGSGHEVQTTLTGTGGAPVKKKYLQKSLRMDKPDERPDMDYDPYWLAEGIRVEMEHTNDPEIAKEIAKDHLDEFDGYYLSLKKMENGLRKAGVRFTHIEPKEISESLCKAKVYINHPSEAPRGRPVRRGNKGGYYYITSEHKRGGKGEGTGPRKKKESPKHAKGWGDTGSEPAGEEVPMMPPPPPDIPEAEEQIKIEGLGVGVTIATVGGHLVVRKLDNGPTAQFLKIVEKKSGENPNAEKIIKLMLMTAQEMGLEIYE